MKQIKTEVLIIGAGPVGLFTAFQATKMHKIECVLVDSLDKIGGQCSELYPEKPIYDIPGCPGITAQNLIDNLHTQLTQDNKLKPSIYLNQSTHGIKKEDHYWISSSNDLEIHSKAIIIAGGGGSFVPNKPAIENIEDFENKSVFYKVTHKESFKDKIVAIAGGGDSATDWTIELSSIAKKIYLIHRRNKFRCSNENMEKIKSLEDEGKIQLMTPYQLHSLSGKEGFLQSMQLKNFKDESIVDIAIDILLPLFGLKMESGAILNWGLDIEEKRGGQYIKTEQSTMRTNLPGVYAIGDIATYDNKLKLILAGFAEGASACGDILKTHFPEKDQSFEYSTSKCSE